jgi:catechol 2,3-dioxygenase-like lactoylglutathione lyase family enzyme
MEAAIGHSQITQVALVVRSMAQTKARIAKMLGVPEPPHFDAGDFAVTKTWYKGEEAPDINCLLAFFDAGGGVQLELIQPNGVPSVWQDFLDQKGEGLHHIAFAVEGMDKQILSCENFGMKLVQKGNYGDNSGCYSYLEGGEGLPCLIELVENF